MLAPAAEINMEANRDSAPLNRDYRGYKARAADGRGTIHDVEQITIGQDGSPIHEAPLPPPPDKLFVGAKPRKEAGANVFDWGPGASEDMVRNLARAILWSAAHDEAGVLAGEAKLCAMLKSLDGEQFHIEADKIRSVLAAAQ
jgi:hypothetical protein